jgi:hypothetical protein
MKHVLDGTANQGWYGSLVVYWRPPRGGTAEHTSALW